MSESLNTSRPRSPCIGVCTVGLDNLCEGCFRSLDEITQWSKMSPEQQRAAIANTWARAKRAGKLL